MTEKTVKPECAVFGACGGCLYQDITYENELVIKESKVKHSLQAALSLSDDVFEPITASPKAYRYRNRLDLSLLRTRDGRVHIGFRPEGGFRVMDIDDCPIAQESIGKFIPELKIQAAAKLTPQYRIASLVLKTGDDSRVKWGGIGKGSLKLNESDYLWVEIQGKRVHYSLDSFFQANNSILPLLKSKIDDWVAWDKSKNEFLDLYSGVGLFGILFAGQVKRVFMIEENPHAMKVAKYNVEYHGYSNIEMMCAKIEDAFQKINISKDAIAMVDPPRHGLSPSASAFLSREKRIKRLLYLSCHPESLERDLAIFEAQDWTIKKVAAFDFFPRTKHIETLVLLEA